MSCRYVALLRGINVGGKNVIPQQALRSSFAELGFEDVRTYIQSGNVLFQSQEKSIKSLTGIIEQKLSDRFSYPACAVVVSRRKYAAAVQKAPVSWGLTDDWKHNALFTLSEITPRQVLAQLPAPRLDIESVAVGPGVLFWSASKRQLAKTTMTKLAAAAAYQKLTVRNHRTVLRLRELLDVD